MLPRSRESKLPVNWAAMDELKELLQGEEIDYERALNCLGRILDV